MSRTLMPAGQAAAPSNTTKYLLWGGLALAVAGGVYVLSRPRKNPVVDARGRPKGLKGRHYVPAAELRRKAARKGRKGRKGGKARGRKR